MNDNKKSLFDIDYDIKKVYSELEENGGELTPEIEESLRISEEEAESKLRGYRYILSKNEADIAILKDERDRLSKRSKSIESLSKNLKQRIVGFLNEHGITTKSGTKTLKYLDFSVSTREFENVTYNEDYIDVIKNNVDLVLKDDLDVEEKRILKSKIQCISSISKTTISFDIDLDKVVNFIKNIKLLYNIGYNIDIKILKSAIPSLYDKVKVLYEDLNKYDKDSKDYENILNEIKIIESVLDDLQVSINKLETAIFK